MKIDEVNRIIREFVLHNYENRKGVILEVVISALFGEFEA